MSNHTLIQHAFGGTPRVLAALTILALAGTSGFAASGVTLDDFQSGSYTVSLQNAQAKDIHFAPLAPGSQLGPARYTAFTIGANPYKQRAKLAIGSGICVVDTDFGINSGLQIYYGYNGSGKASPLGLDLSPYSALQLNFAGLSNSEALGVEIAIWLHDGSVFGSQLLVNPSASAFSVTFPFSGFSPRALTSIDVSNIDHIGIVTWGGTAAYGITSFAAVD